MALPRAVQKKVDEANRLAAKLNEPAPDPSAPPAPDVALAPDAVAPTPTPAPAAVAPPVEPPAPTPLPQESAEQRYKVLQGKYNAEVPRLQTKVREQDNEIRQMRDQLTATQNLLASMSTQRSAAAAAPQELPAPTRLVNDEEVREFGSDLIDVMRRVAREENATLLPQVETKVRAASQRVEEVAGQVTAANQKLALNSRQQTIDYLHEKVPTASEVNRDPAFIAWLEQVDPFSGQERGQLLAQAFQSFDGPRVVAFFQGFLKEHAVVTPRPSAAAPGAQPVAPQRKLDDLVAPGTAKPGAASTQDGSGKRVWSRAEITQFYKDKAIKYRGKAQEAAVIEAEIFAAQREGRIR